MKSAPATAPLRRSGGKTAHMGADALIGPGDAQSNSRRVIPPEGREPPPMAADALNVNPPEKIK